MEQAGDEVFELVEATRQGAIAARRRSADERVTFDVLPIDAATLEGVVRAFGLYFQLINLAEARDRVRRATRRARATAGRPRARGCGSPFAGRTSARPSHPSGSRPCSPRTLRRRDAGPSSSRCEGSRACSSGPTTRGSRPSVDRDLRRQLREEIAILWRTAELRRGAPSPLDEVRTAMVVFDETLYRLTPQLYGLVDTFMPGPRSARVRELQEPHIPAFLRFGSWIGGDRDGHPDGDLRRDRGDHPDPCRPRPPRPRGGRQPAVADRSR